MKISIVIPCRNEADNLAFLLDEAKTAFSGRDYEIIVVDDGSSDHTCDFLKERKAIDGSNLRVMKHDQSAGQSAAIRTGVFSAVGAIICTMDGDGQNDPAYLPQLVDALIAAGPETGLAAGQRLGRTDTRLKKFSSRFANAIRQSILKDGCRDTGCGLKAIHTELFRSFPYFDGWHRYLPALAHREGFSVIHLDVFDRPRRHGQSNYGVFDRGVRGILDLYGVWWLKKRRRVRPKTTEINS